jgi:putative spermidine/putrescine transport system substrate-binding protein
MAANGTVSRRQVLAGLGRAALGASLVPSALAASRGVRRAEAAKGELTYVAYGGGYGDALKAAFIEPFEKETGIKVNFDISGPSLAKIKAMVEAKQVTWDVVDAEGSWEVILAKEGLLEKLDYSVIDTRQVRPDAVEPYRPYGVSKQDYGFCLAWNTKALSAPKQIPGLVSGETWKEFWDVKKFPGRRGLQPLILNGMLEFALLADGVAKNKLYPLDVDRAFASLDKIKPNIKLWSDNQTQSAQVLVDNELDMCHVTSGRVPVLKRKGAPVDQHYAQGAILPNPVIIPKGAPNRENAMKFINFMLKPEAQARLSSLIPYGPTVPKAFDLIEPSLAKDICSHPDNLPKQFRVDDAWWAEHESAMYEKFSAWLGK